MMSISSESPHKGAQAKSNPLGLLSPNTTAPGEIAKKLSSETAKQKQVGDAVALPPFIQRMKKWCEDDERNNPASLANPKLPIIVSIENDVGSDGEDEAASNLSDAPRVPAAGPAVDRPRHDCVYNLQVTYILSTF